MKILRSLALLLSGAVLLSGCDFSVYDLPLPGGADVGSDPITVTVQFRDVLDLVPRSTVKINDVDVGQVTDVRLTGFTAEVDLTINKDTKLPDNAMAEIRQTSLLGEKFVQLEAPTSDPSSNLLASGDTIPLARSGRNPEVEEVLGALSLILNGGGVGQLKTIVTELNKTLDGRESNIRSLLTQFDDFSGQLDSNKTAIVGAIEALNRLSLSVRQQQPSIDRALAELPSALDSINRQRDDLKNMLTSLDRLGGVAVGVINRSKAVTIESLQQLQPVLTQLSNSGDNFVKAFNVFLTYPFIDEVVGRDPQVARNLHMGDYVNLSAQLNLSIKTLDLPTSGLPSPTLPTLPTPTLPTVPLPALPTVPLPSLPNVPCKTLDQLPATGDLTGVDLTGFCKKVKKTVNKCLKKQSVKACKKLPDAVIEAVCNTAPGQILGGALCPGSGGGGGGGGPLPGGGLPSVPLPGGLGAGGGGGLGGLGGNRVGFGDGARGVPTGTPTMGQILDVYDPALATLLIPGMVTR